jgi:hypothetical protein
MSDIADEFCAAFGKPDPPATAGVHFQWEFYQVVWDVSAPRTGAGWYRDRFLYLFGEGLEPLRECLDTWSFIVPANGDRMIIGRNAYGAIAYIDDANTSKARVKILDPLNVAILEDNGLDFTSFIGLYLPKNLLPAFLDDSVYREFLDKNELYLDLHDALAIKQPLTLGGKMEIDNFDVEDILAYYKSTASIYAKGFKAPRR